MVPLPSYHKSCAIIAFYRNIVNNNHNNLKKPGKGFSAWLLRESDPATVLTCFLPFHLPPSSGPPADLLVADIYTIISTFKP